MRIIDADALKSYVKNFNIGCGCSENYQKSFLDAINDQPTIEERKTGKWILTEDDDYEYCTCSECGYQNGENWMNGSDIPFCAICGAEMEIREPTMEEFMYGQDMGNFEDGSL